MSNIVAVRRELIHPAECCGNGTLESYIRKVFKWGRDRNITAEGGATVGGQLVKLREEVDELYSAVEANNRTDMQDAMGDCLVVLVQISRLSGIPLDDALISAWNEIKDRQGKLVCGVFVKQETLDAWDKLNIDWQDISTLTELEAKLNAAADYIQDSGE